MINNKFQQIYRAIILQQQQLDKHQHEAQTSVMKIFNNYRDIINDKVPESNQDKCSQQLSNLANKLEEQEDKLIKLAKENGKKIIKKYIQQKSEKDESTGEKIDSQEFQVKGKNQTYKVLMSEIQWSNKPYLMFEVCLPKKEARLSGAQNTANKICNHAFLQYLKANGINIKLGLRKDQMPRKLLTLNPQNEGEQVYGFGIKKAYVKK